MKLNFRGLQPKERAGYIQSLEQRFYSSKMQALDKGQKQPTPLPPPIQPVSQPQQNTVIDTPTGGLLPPQGQYAQHTPTSEAYTLSTPYNTPSEQSQSAYQQPQQVSYQQTQVAQFSQNPSPSVNPAARVPQLPQPYQPSEQSNQPYPPLYETSRPQ